MTCGGLFLSAHLVGAPAGEVHPPVVQLQLGVSCSVGAVEPHVTTLTLHNKENILSLSAFFNNVTDCKFKGAQRGNVPVQEPQRCWTLVELMTVKT